jgi:CubicO group peptidase (beta-lactamase class C family)
MSPRIFAKATRTFATTTHREAGTVSAATKAVLSVGILAVLVAGCGGANASPLVATDFARFATELDHLREQLAIPGMSAAIVHDQELVWAAGFGYADIESEVPVTPDTPFHLASVTKPIAATLLMQLVEEGVLDLDRPVADYGVDIEDANVVTSRHLLTHTSEGTPGTSYSYNGNRYGLLGHVIEGATGTPFRDQLAARILEPLGMTSTAPSRGLPSHPGGLPDVVRSSRRAHLIRRGSRPLRRSSRRRRAALRNGEGRHVRTSGVQLRRPQRSDVRPWLARAGA